MAARLKYTLVSANFGPPLFPHGMHPILSISFHFLVCKLVGLGGVAFEGVMIGVERVGWCLC